MPPLTNLAKFHRARYTVALQMILHSNVAEALDICYNLLLQPELSPFLRALINLTLATKSSIFRHPDKMTFVDDAKAILADLRTWAPEGNSERDLTFLAGQVEVAEATVKKQLEEVAAHKKEEDDAGKEEGEDVKMKDTVVTDEDESSPEPVVAIPILTKAQKKAAETLPTPPPSSIYGGNGNGNRDSDSNGKGYNGGHDG